MNSIVENAVVEIARGRPATQSSISAYSRGATVEADAAGAVRGRPDGTTGLHTALEDRPWWRVDLEASHRIERIAIANRYATPALAARVLPLVIELSADGEEWVALHRRAEPFGGDPTGDGLVWTAGMDTPDIARFARHVRLRVDGVGMLHLDRVEVFGVAHPPVAALSWADGTVMAEDAPDADISDRTGPAREPEASGGTVREGPDGPSDTTGHAETTPPDPRPGDPDETPDETPSSMRAPMAAEMAQASDRAERDAEADPPPVALQADAAVRRDPSERGDTDAARVPQAGSEPHPETAWSSRVPARPAGREDWPELPNASSEPPGDAPADPEENFVTRMRRALFGG